ncbi:MAG: hypothetical protein U5L11_04265 [Arhodomonas sp.]|nr:hypothetical protein [Arhodomonas sp.]
MRRVILETLALDPRPAYRRGESGRSHGMSVAGYNVRWCGEGEGIRVISVTPLTGPAGDRGP